MTASHAQFLSRYTAALPATVTPKIDRARHTIEYRIAGPKLSVQVAIDRLADMLSRFGIPENIKWRAARFPPQLIYGGEWVSHLEVYVPREAENFWRMVGPKETE